MSASRETAYNPDAYDPQISPLDEHCGAFAYVIQQWMGGKIIMSKINGERHFWNELVNGDQVDFSSCQFGGDGITPVYTGGIVMPPRKAVNKRFQQYKATVDKHAAALYNA